PVRSFASVGGTPVVVASGRGCRIRTVDGDTFVDYCGSWGPLILGHAHPEVVAAVKAAVENGMTFGIHTAAEVELAELICERVPSIEKIRLVSSGTEAVMTALRLARGVTGRNGLLKFEGCYHGHSDAMLVAAGSGLLTHGIQTSAGVPDGIADDVFVAPYNDLEAVAAIVEKHGRDLAGIIVEPLAGNMGLVSPEPGFLEGLRAAADGCGALLIFDEVISAFRLGPTTYGELCGVRPDLTTLGKIIGGGMPIGAVGGRADVMDALAPSGRVYQAGTLSGNPVAVAAGRTTLEILKRDFPYPQLDRLGARLETGLRDVTAKRNAPLCVSRRGGMFTVFFRDAPVRCLADAKTCDTKAYAAFFHGMLRRGVYLPPSQFETAFLSVAHDEGTIDAFIAHVAAVLSP
ncbi:MAG: glutamate-1-semialdehyde 2,1-aminomutase, partial [bacterium]